MATTPVVFLKEVNEELKKVVWPTRPEVIRLTTVVILVSLIVGIYLGALDLIFTKLLALFIK
jgi:preprotein translocase subunit SecE